MTQQQTPHHQPSCHVNILCLTCCGLQVINDIRGRTGARVNLFDEERRCGDRVLQASGTCCL